MKEQESEIEKKKRRGKISDIRRSSKVQQLFVLKLTKENPLSCMGVSTLAFFFYFPLLYGPSFLSYSTIYSELKIIWISVMVKCLCGCFAIKLPKNKRTK